MQGIPANLKPILTSWFGMHGHLVVRPYNDHEVKIGFRFAGFISYLTCSRTYYSSKLVFVKGSLIAAR